MQTQRYSSEPLSAFVPGISSALDSLRPPDIVAGLSLPSHFPPVGNIELPP